MNETDARTIPIDAFRCPICGAGLWIESIDEAVQEGDRWVPACITLSCETEPDIDSKDWREWHKGHFSTPYIDWLPVELGVIDWLEKPEQRQRFEVIWGSGHAVLAGG